MDTQTLQLMLGTLSLIPRRSPEDTIRLVEIAYILLHKLVYYHAWRVTYNREDAEDLAQDFWVHLQGVIHHFSGSKGVFLGWFRRVLKNFLISYIRKRKALSDISFESIDGGSDDGSGTIEIPDHSDPGVLVADGELGQRIQAAFAQFQLTAREQVVLRLFYEDGLRIKQIAGYLNRKESTVKTHLHSGRKKLRQILDDIFADYNC